MSESISHPPAAKPCDCVTRMDSLLREKGYCIARSVSSLTLDPQLNIARVSYNLPVERVDRKRLKSGEARGILISHCPFCGQKF